MSVKITPFALGARIAEIFPHPFSCRKYFHTASGEWVFFGGAAAKKHPLSWLLEKMLPEPICSTRGEEKMKKILMITSLMALIILSLSGCTINMVTGSGKLVTSNRPVSGFTSLLFAGIGDVTIIQGATESLKIEAEDNIMDKIVTTVKSGQLYIGFERENWQDLVNPTKGIKFTLTVKNLNSIELSGAGSITAPSFKADKLTIQVGGGGGINLAKLEAASITVNMSGAGNVELKGKVTDLSATLSGVGNFACGDLQVVNAKVNVTGAGGSTIWARDNLNVSITGAGSVGYYGTPKLIKTVTGLGVLNELGAK